MKFDVHGRGMRRRHESKVCFPGMDTLEVLVKGCMKHFVTRVRSDSSELQSVPRKDIRKVWLHDSEETQSHIHIYLPAYIYRQPVSTHYGNATVPH